MVNSILTEAGQTEGFIDEYGNIFERPSVYAWPRHPSPGTRVFTQP